MATRFYLCSSADPGITPAFDGGWAETDGAVRRFMVPSTSDPLADAIAQGANQSSTAGNSQLHRQYISRGMNPGLAFTTGTTFKCQILGAESAANDNIINRVRCVKIISHDGGTERATLISLGNATSTGEWNPTSVRNLSFLTGQASGANYTTVLGDRLLLEVGHNDSGGSTVSGVLRFGITSGTGDLAENETDTTTSLRAWFETSLDLTFATVSMPHPRSYAYVNTR